MAAKRQGRAPKAHVRDSGFLHALLGIGDRHQIEHHPRDGASWEGYAVEQILWALRPDEAYDRATHCGAEIDLVLFERGRRNGAECKRMDAPVLTPSMRIALNDLDLDELLVVYPGRKRYRLGAGKPILLRGELGTSMSRLMIRGPPPGRTSLRDEGECDYSGGTEFRGIVLEIERRLAAILAADVEGYSRLMAADEEGTLRALTARRAAMDRLIARHRGRIVGTAGDSVLAEFASVVDAVSCALAVQAAMAEANAGEPDDKQMRFRIGINLGDVLVKGTDIFGDGVNVAARLEALAEPGGVCVSGTVHDHVAGKVEASFVDLGEQQVKNIAQPVRAWRVGPKLIATRSATDARPALPLPDKPSLVVLPFQNMSGDPEQEYFADGMTEEITTALSRIRQFFVIARNTAFTYKGKKLDLKQVGRELGVRYLLEGSVRKAGNRVRITGQLIEAESGSHLWADKFDGALEDVFDLQDRVTENVAGVIEPTITRAEIERAGRKPPESLQAYDLLLQALALAFPITRDRNEQAIAFASRAIEIDPRYSLAHAVFAWLSGYRRNRLWMQDENAETAYAARSAFRAVELDANDAQVLSYAGYGRVLLTYDSEGALPWLDRAVALNPNSALAHGFSAGANLFVGNYARAIDLAKRAVRLSPFDLHITTFYWAIGVSHLHRRELDEAIEWLAKSIQELPSQPSSLTWRASALAHLGRLDEARESIARVLELRPGTTIRWFRERSGVKKRDDLEFVLDGLRLAGLPE